LFKNSKFWKKILDSGKILENKKFFLLSNLKTILF